MTKYNWPWPWPNDYDTQTWLRYGHNVSLYWKWSSYLQQFKSYSPNRQTDTQTDLSEIITYPHTRMVKTFSFMCLNVLNYRLTFCYFENLKESLTTKKLGKNFKWSKQCCLCRSVNRRHQLHWRIQIFTAPIRGMGKVIISVCLSVHTLGGITTSPSHNTFTGPMSFTGGTQVTGHRFLLRNVPQWLVPVPF